MRRPLLTASLLLFGICVFSQNLTFVNFSGGASFSSFSFKTDQGVIIRISDDGRLLEWGTEAESRYPGYFPGKLQPFMGRVDYYGPEADTISRGKARNIGTCVLSYYGSFESPIRKGKLKSLGSVVFDYFTDYSNEAFRGKLQFAGSAAFNYYASYDNEAFKGKLKSVSNTPISYYSTFDDKTVSGKLKSIGTNNYIWYISNDQYKGGLKSGSLRPIINGITYNIM